MRKVCIGCLAVLSLSACAGRAPQPIPLVMVSDRQLDCDGIKAGIVGFMVWPAWLGLDLQDAAGKEAAALSQRNEYLLALARERCQPRSQTASLPQADPTFSPLASNAEILSTSLVSY